MNNKKMFFLLFIIFIALLAGGAYTWWLYNQKETLAISLDLTKKTQTEMKTDAKRLEGENENLQKQNINLDDIPYVLQYNKRDMPAVAPLNYLEYALNNRKMRVQSFEVVASTGQNVFSTLNAISRLLLYKFTKESDLTNKRSKTTVLMSTVR